MPAHDSSHQKTYHHGDLRNTLVAAGLALLDAEGGAALDLRRVAREAGVSHTAPYRHFADKEALHAAVAQACFESLSALMMMTETNVPNTAQAELIATGHCYVGFAISYPQRLRLMFSGLITKPEVYPTLYAQAKVAFHRLTEIVARGQREGSFVTNQAPESMALTIWSTIHGVATLVVDKQLGVDPADTPAVRQMTETCIATLYHGLREG